MHQGGQVMSERSLHDFVARGFRELLDPTGGHAEDDTLLTLPDIVRVLKEMDWVSTQSKDVDGDLIKEGSIVRIHERRRATVSSVLPPEAGSVKKRYLVQYDELEEGDEAEGDILYEEEMHVRTMMPKVPKYLLSTKIKENIRKVAWQIDYGKKSAVIPALQFIRDVVTWKKACLAGFIVAFFVIKIIVFLFCFCSNWNIIDTEGSVASLVWISEHAGDYVFIGVLILTFTVFAQPLGWIMPMARMRKEWHTSKRAAPDMWPFFTPVGTGPDDVVLDMVSNESRPSNKASPGDDDGTAGKVPLLQPGSGAKRSCLPCFRPSATNDT
jgi:hypothetical protein